VTVVAGKRCFLNVSARFADFGGWCGEILPALARWLHLISVGQGVVEIPRLRNTIRTTSTRDSGDKIMQLITIGVLTALSLIAMGSSAKADVVLGVVDISPKASLAWAGENECFATLAVAPVDQLAEGDIDVKLMTALAAPEPPAIVLAGMALGGLICGRSILQKRRKAVKETT
jgi:hypothetical protein